MATAQFDFLTEYVLQLLEDNGLGDLTEEQRNAYVPQLLSQLEERIGLQLLPTLSDEDKQSFVALIQNESASAEDWQTFWHNAVPDFEAQMSAILLAFGKEVQEALQSTRV